MLKVDNLHATVAGKEILKGLSLAEGFVDGETLECWAHGSKFSLASGKPLTLPAYEPVPVYELTIVDGDVYIDPTKTKEIV